MNYLFSEGGRRGCSTPPSAWLEASAIPGFHSHEDMLRTSIRGISKYNCNHISKSGASDLSEYKSEEPSQDEIREVIFITVRKSYKNDTSRLLEKA